jgi:regulator of cell morphogenesis and NO signaling
MTTTLDASSTVGQLVTDRPRRARVFERFGIDYCCGGKRPLAQACVEQGLNLDEVLTALADSAQVASDEPETEWSSVSMTDLANHIVATHHAYLREALPRLAGLFDKVITAHAERHPDLRELRQAFDDLVNELGPHMQKEELVLFPMVRELDRAERAPSFHCGSVNNPIHAMEHEHDNAGAALARMRALTHGYTPPEDACNTYRALLDSLDELERDMHTHIHKENNILFPRAAARERQLVENAP